MTLGSSNSLNSKSKLHAPQTLPWLAIFSLSLTLTLAQTPSVASSDLPETIDFNRDVRRILSENCFICHGPDANERKGRRDGLRLDIADGAYRQIGGPVAVVPGDPDASDLIQRIESSDPDELMPPPGSRQPLSSRERSLLRRWIEQGAVYAKHWAYEAPIRLPLPQTSIRDWIRNPIDAFILKRLETEGLAPSPEADPATIVRRLSLDLTGLPPKVEDTDAFLLDSEPEAYERVVDRLLQSDAYGEHWAHRWLDLARYADSSGYADDPSRTIWAYRDYVIRSLNENKPFDQFTIEQIAGDLMPDASEEALVATAFHRNTMTNNEGGTSDEEFRNVAVVDRVNTTFAVWMGTTMACAQCHDHKYDPISQADYFRSFAILNNTADADRTDESPVLPLHTLEQKQEMETLKAAIARFELELKTPTDALVEAQRAWETNITTEPLWQVQHGTLTTTSGTSGTLADDGSFAIERTAPSESYRISAPILAEERVTALRIEVLPDERPPGRGVGHAGGNFVLTGIRAEVVPTLDNTTRARYLRIELPGEGKILSLAEVEVHSNGKNIALGGSATQSSTAFGGSAERAIDGNTNGHFANANSTTHTDTSSNPWWEVDLLEIQPIERIVVWNRTDGSGERLNTFNVILMDADRGPVWQQRIRETPNPNRHILPGGGREIPLALATASYSQPGFSAASILASAGTANVGWAIAPRFGEAHSLYIVPEAAPTVMPSSNIVVHLDQLSSHAHATMARVRFAYSTDSWASEYIRAPSSLREIARISPQERSPDQQELLQTHYLSIAPDLEETRQRLANARDSLKNIKPYTTVPILRELAGENRRQTRLQLRGNFLDLGEPVEAGFPQTLHRAPDGDVRDRLALAKWLVDDSNPLTARVIANRLWEGIFGIGIVETSEEFGAQGELPSHPELLDWLAVELVESGWDLQHLLRLMVGSAAYRQSSAVSPELSATDPDNRLLARGPRFRLSAEMIRDQALYIGGLLSRKMHGPPVRPHQPRMGLSAAFGSGTDWETSAGEDRYRRALYTTWRRSNPYPSMATFDAPSREVCTVRRDRSNTPLQALVILNDPVHVEAAQGLARRIASAASSPRGKIWYGFRLCLSRRPTDQELNTLLSLYARIYERFLEDSEQAMQLAGKHPNDQPPTDAAELAAWTVVANVLLNLDEMLMKP